MATICLGGRLIVERAGPIWHLVGVPKRDFASKDRLTLWRRSDSLSLLIKSSVGRLLPVLQITDPSGTTATLLNARIHWPIAVAQYFPKFTQLGTYGHHSSQVDTNELDKISFTFQKIEISNTSRKKSFDDDWGAS